MQYNLLPVEDETLKNKKLLNKPEIAYFYIFKNNKALNLEKEKAFVTLTEFDRIGNVLKEYPVKTNGSICELDIRSLDKPFQYTNYAFLIRYENKHCEFFPEFDFLALKFQCVPNNEYKILER